MLPDIGSAVVIRQRSGTWVRVAVTGAPVQQNAQGMNLIEFMVTRGTGTPPESARKCKSSS